MTPEFNTPILFLIFNRPDTTQLVFNVIRHVKPKQLFVAADGPRRDKDGDEEKCEVARKIIKQIDWDCEVKTLFREENLGCGKAVSSAVTWFFENVEEGIILEDDCLPVDSFFFFCQLMLEKYRDNLQIGMISGTNYLFGYNNFQYSYFFSKLYYIWGWATWKRAWNLFDLNIQVFPDKLFLKKYFENNLISDYYLDQFDSFKLNKIDTWDIQWSAALIKNKLYSIIPINNQISNIGLSGSHTNQKTSLSINMSTKIIATDEIKNPPDIFYEKILDYISMKNIVFKVMKRFFLTNFLIKIIKRKNIELIKRMLTFKF